MSCDDKIITWLNGRLASSLVVMHNGKRRTIWTQKEAQESGLTIEDAVARFADRNNIDLDREAGE